jgi:hypothetical protein
MSKPIITLIMVVVLAVNGYFFWKLVNCKRQSNRSSREIQVIDSVRHRYDSLMDRKVDSTAFATFKQTQEAANRELALAKHSEKKFKHEKDTVRVFTDPQTDSLLSATR